MAPVWYPTVQGQLDLHRNAFTASPHFVRGRLLRPLHDGLGRDLVWMQIDQVVRSAPALVRGLLGSGPARPLVAGEAARAAVEADVDEADDDLSHRSAPRCSGEMSLASRSMRSWRIDGAPRSSTLPAHVPGRRRLVRHRHLSKLPRSRTASPMSAGSGSASSSALTARLLRLAR